jgi:glutathione synthase/RimK-type ligase-like ATP-grasp enzyme
VKNGPIVLVVSNKHDAHVPLVLQHLQARGVPCFVLNTEDFGTEYRAEFLIGKELPTWRLRSSVADLPVSEITAVWYRRPEQPDLSTCLNGGARQFAEFELKSFVDSLLASLDCLWVSAPAAIRRAGHKLYQLSAARELGFDVPPTLVSQDPERIRAFSREVGLPMIAKLISKGPPRTSRIEEQYVVFTELLDEQCLSDDDALRICPAIYQPYVEKAYELRVTVVGTEVFACRIESQATERTRIDWRNYDLDHTPHTATALEPGLSERCVALVRQFGLRFGAIDLIVTPDGRTIFLEINPNGQWGWIEEITGLPIAAAHAELLSRVQ